MENFVTLKLNGYLNNGEEFKNHLRKFSYRDFNVKKYDSLKIIDLGICFDESNKLIRETSANEQFMIECYKLENRRGELFLNSEALNWKEKEINGRFILLDIITGGCYYHWWIDILCRYFYAQEHQLIENSDSETVKLLLREDFKNNKFIQETIRLLNIENKIYYVPNSIITKITGEIHIISATSREEGNIIFNPYAMNKMRELRKRLLGDDQKPFRKIYISRKDATMRNILNEEEFISDLIERNFEIVTLSNMSVIEQIKLYYESEIVLGPHGASFTNLAFCTSKAKIIELLPECLWWQDSCFMKWSNYLENEHCFIDVGLAKQNESPHHDNLIMTDKKIFLKCLDKIMI